MLSVVIATVDPWPQIKECLESLTYQVGDIKIEVMVVDGHGEGLPEDQGFSGIIRMQEIGASVFRLRALGLSKANGEIVAFTEDHCKVAPDWCKQIVDLHTAYPNVAAIGGVVENGATASLLDWVHFLIAKGPFMKPVRKGESQSVTGQENVSFKRKFLPKSFSKNGILQMSFNREMMRKGLKLMMSDRPVVWHVQSLGLVGTCTMHFHTGKCIAGFRRHHLSFLMWMLRLCSCMILPAFLTARTFHTVFTKKRQRLALIMGTPLLLLLTTCHTIGELMGYLFGPGASPSMVR